LVAVDYSAIRAEVMTTIGHGWAVSSGGMASACGSLFAVAHVPGMLIAP